MYKLISIILVSFLIIFSSNLSAKIQIKYKIGDEIITNIDVFDEKNYLIFLRPNLKDLSQTEILKIAENSLIREIIKKKEINKIFKNFNNEILNEGIKKKLFSFKNVNNEDEFLNLLKDSKIEYNKIIEKMKYEALWNELIFQKYSSLIKIDKSILKSELMIKIKENKKYEYNLSEILFEIESPEDLKRKYNDIMKYIELNNFKTAATKYSISNSARIGGKIGWIKETLLSNDLINILANMKKYEISDPIKYPNGYLLLKINDKKEMKQVINIEQELEELINFEKQKQLNQFSLLFYKKLKQNTIINEN